jgi:taurine transport system substrate-binding protein
VTLLREFSPSRYGAAYEYAVYRCANAWSYRHVLLYSHHAVRVSHARRKMTLLAALKHWGIKPGQVQILNLQPPAIIAAWQRGDIDGAYVWAPAVNELEKEGTVLTDSEKVGQWGSPTLDVWVVRKDFAEKHPDVVKAFAKSAIDAQQPYIANPDEWLKQPANLEKLSRLSGVPEADVPGLVKGNTYLTPAQQVQQLTGPVNKAIVDTAGFLKEQGKVPAVAADYSQFVTDRFVK